MHNIKISKETADYLDQFVIDEYEFGRGENDRDVVCIMRHQLIDKMPLNTNHWLHYKDKSTDRLYVTDVVFNRAIISGLSHVAYEALRSNDEELFKAFYSYKMIKCYLGVARKDIKQAKAMTGKKLEKKMRFVWDAISLVSKLMSVPYCKDDDPIVIVDHFRVVANEKLNSGELHMFDNNEINLYADENMQRLYEEIQKSLGDN